MRPNKGLSLGCGVVVDYPPRRHWAGQANEPPVNLALSAHRTARPQIGTCRSATRHQCLVLGANERTNGITADPGEKLTREELLFWGSSLRDYLERRTEELRAEIERTPEDHVIQADEEAWIEALVEKFEVQVPGLGEVWMDRPEEVEVDVSYDHFRRAISDPSTPTYVPGYRVVLHLPFDGDPNVFEMQASTYSLNPPRGTLRQGEITRTIEYPADTPVDFDTQAKQLEDDITGHLVFAKKDLGRYPDRLAQQARNCIRGRRERIEKHRAQLADTDVPIGPPEDREKTSIVEAVVRRPSPAPRLAAGSKETRPVNLEPALDREVYQHILELIRDVGIGMEKTPMTYSSMSEEEKRDVFLTNLNTHYRGKTSAEAFNFGGRTDLLISYENKNLFVGECKIWRGEKDFAEAIDQLFGYTAWRDTRLALVMFVEQKALTKIIAKAKKALAEHQQFIDWADSASETELRAKMAWPGDSDRVIDMAVFFFHLPSGDG